MANIINNYASGSCVFESGSTQNGDVAIKDCTINQVGKSNASKKEVEDIGSPIGGSNISKIDLIRLMNALYEYGHFKDVNDKRLNKSDFFIWIGKVFNLDLANYDKDLSNSISVCASEDAQLKIFNELRETHKEYYEKKLNNRGK